MLKYKYYSLHKTPAKKQQNKTKQKNRIWVCDIATLNSIEQYWTQHGPLAYPASYWPHTTDHHCSASSWHRELLWDSLGPVVVLECSGRLFNFQNQITLLPWISLSVAYKKSVVKRKIFLLSFKVCEQFCFLLIIPLCLSTGKSLLLK